MVMEAKWNLSTAMFTASHTHILLTFMFLQFFIRTKLVYEKFVHNIHQQKHISLDYVYNLFTLLRLHVKIFLSVLKSHHRYLEYNVNTYGTTCLRFIQSLLYYWNAVAFQFQRSLTGPFRPLLSSKFLSIQYLIKSDTQLLRSCGIPIILVWC